MPEQSKRNINIKQIINLATKMIHLADKGFSHCDDDGCLLLYSLVRDGAYKMKIAAEKEQQIHEGRGKKNPGLNYVKKEKTANHKRRRGK